jgi:hypothetical protein
MKYHYLNCLFFFLTVHCALAQKMTFSEINRRDNQDMYFEILGKFGTDILVYKSISREHELSRYDAEMKQVSTVKLDYLPERIFNIDFVNYPTYCYLIYQHQRNGIVYCNAVKVDQQGKAVGAVRLLDTTRIGFFADNKIYTTTFSEDKKKLLIYKKHLKNDNLTIVTKLFDADLNQIDSTHQFLQFDDRKEVYSDIYVDNEGTVVYAKEKKKTSNDNTSDLELWLHQPGAVEFEHTQVSLQKKYIEEASIKIDNLNRQYIVNSFYYSSRRGSIEGLFTAIVKKDLLQLPRAAFNPFSDSLRSTINSSDQYKFVFDNLTTRNVVVKKNGGFFIAAEDFYSETRSFNNAWNRNYYNNFQNTTMNDFYLYNPYYYGYRPWSSFNGDQSTRYYYDDIVILSIDSSLKLVWNNIIHKKQYDVDNDNFLSYSVINAGGEVHFLFIEKDRQKHILSNQGILPGGEINRYPTLRSIENGIEFMPRLGKQVGARVMIMPFIQRGKIGFARIDF